MAISRRVKERGKRKGATLFDEVDYHVLKMLNENKNELSIGDVQNKLKMSHVSFKVHIRRLIKWKFITKNRLPKTFKFILNLTEDGKRVLEIFDKVMWSE